METLPPDVGDTTGLASVPCSRLQDFLSPLLVRLDHALDRRLVKTFADTISIILHQPHRASALLLTLLDPEPKWLKDALLHRFCPRTPQRSREASAPLYRLRSTMLFLFLSLRTLGPPQPQTPG